MYKRLQKQKTCGEEFEKLFGMRDRTVEKLFCSKFDFSQEAKIVSFHLKCFHLKSCSNSPRNSVLKVMGHNHKTVLLQQKFCFHLRDIYLDSMCYCILQKLVLAFCIIPMSHSSLKPVILGV